MLYSRAAPRYTAREHILHVTLEIRRLQLGENWENYALVREVAISENIWRRIDSVGLSGSHQSLLAKIVRR